MFGESHSSIFWATWVSLALGVHSRWLFFFVSFFCSYSRLLETFVTSHCALDHNHEVSEDLFKLYPDQRRPTGALAEDVDNMLSVNGNPTLVAQVLHKQGHAVRVKDIHNRKQKLAECGAALPDRLRGTLSAPDVHYRMLQSDTQKFQALFIQTDRQRTIFAKYGEMVQLDATYKVRVHYFLLFTSGYDCWFVWAWGSRWRRFDDPSLHRFCLIHPCDRQTDGRTDRQNCDG